MAQAPKGDFLSNLGRIYGIYTGGFIAFVILLGILEQLGVPDKIIGYLFVFLTIGVYALIGIIVANRSIVGVLRRRPACTGFLQRHGDRFRLDERSVVHRHGRIALCARL